MLIRIWCFITLMLTSLSMGMAFGGHLLQMPPRMNYDAMLWHETLEVYELFGPPVGAIIEGGAWISAVILALLLHRRELASRWTVIGAAFFVLTQVIWWLFVFPVNNQTITWTSESIPVDWMDWRTQWEYAHAARAILQICGFGALVYSVMSEVSAIESTD